MTAHPMTLKHAPTCAAVTIFSFHATAPGAFAVSATYPVMTQESQEVPI